MGADNPDIISEAREVQPGNPHALRHPLDWSVIGPVNTQPSSSEFVTHSLPATQYDQLELQTAQTTNCDELPSAQTTMSVGDKKALAILEDSANQDDNSHCGPRPPLRREEQEDWLSLPVISDIPSDDQELKAKLTTFTVVGDSNLSDLSLNHVIDYHSSWIQRKRTKWKDPLGNFILSDVTPMSDENTSREQWALGVITSTYPDDKGLIRTVDIKLRNGISRCLIHKPWLLVQA